jgi:hypothetical protein
MLETIRQYGSDRLGEAGELSEARTRHLSWCLSTAAALGESVAVDAAGYRLAVRLAEVCFQRGLPGEAQRRYEQAAALADDDGRAAGALHSAAEAAKARHSAPRRSGSIAPPPMRRSAPVTARARRTTWRRSPS